MVEDSLTASLTLDIINPFNNSTDILQKKKKTPQILGFTNLTVEYYYVISEIMQIKFYVYKVQIRNN